MTKATSHNGPHQLPTGPRIRRRLRYPLNHTSSFKHRLNEFKQFLLVVSQSVSYTDEGIPFNGLIEPTHNVTYGFVFPPTTETSESTEFIGEVIVPVVNKWVGLALGGQMVGDLLLVAWPNDDEIMFSPRWAT